MANPLLLCFFRMILSFPLFRPTIFFRVKKNQARQLPSVHDFFLTVGTKFGIFLFSVHYFFASAEISFWVGQRPDKSVSAHVQQKQSLLPKVKGRASLYVVSHTEKRAFIISAALLQKQFCFLSHLSHFCLWSSFLRKVGRVSPKS